ncbi:MAG: acyl-CoA dehydratase activase [Archaeoglobaceae archaeon]|nr:acyl-CoA dehydratase activase [Archaeoglobaceae archaeon]MDW8118164.1 acyl-CoA dehydratase activase [Archaeoglobaceae archaeon]
MQKARREGGEDEIVLFAGTDVGSLTAQAVVLQDHEVLGWKNMRVLPNPVETAKKVMGELIDELNLKKDEIIIFSTGYGREKLVEVGFAKEHVSEISCHAKGAFWLNPAVRTVIDIGGQDAKVIRIDETGKLINFVMNDKCAAGTGRFLEIQAKALGLRLEELGDATFIAKNPVEITARCSIFAETEVLHFLQRGFSKEDIAAGVNKSMAQRIYYLARRVGVEKEVALTGGVAKNRGVKRELEKILNIKFLDLGMDPQIIGALGAAIFAKEKFGGE